MSSLYVRDTVRAWLANTPGLVLPFFDTINQEVDPPGPQWATVSFLPATVQTISFCHMLQESGSFDYIALGASGVRDSALIEAAEHDVAVLMQQLDPTGRLSLLTPGSADDFLQGAVPWFTVSLSISYLYLHPMPIP